MQEHAARGMHRVLACDACVDALLLTITYKALCVSSARIWSLGFRPYLWKRRKKLEGFSETFCAMPLIYAGGVDTVGVKVKQLRSVLLPLTCQGSPCPPQLRCPAGDCPSQTARFHCRETMVHLWHKILLSQTPDSHWLEQWEEAGLHFYNSVPQWVTLGSRPVQNIQTTH